MIVSQKINVIRYTNGTLVKIMPSAEEFLSPDYDPGNPAAATYLPEEISLEAIPEGDLSIAGWQYSVNGQDWEDVSEYIKGISVSGNIMTILSSCDLFIDGYLIIKAYANDPTYYDTVTLRKEVNPTVAFVKASTAIDQTNRKIALIASEEQLVQFTESQTMVDKMASIEVKADEIASKVTREYATMDYADDVAQDAENAANNATDQKLGNYYTKAQTTSEISQKADQITSSVSKTYQTKADAASDLSEAKDYTDDQLEGYSTTAEVESKIQQSASSITATVSSTYQTKSQAQTDLNTAKKYAEDEADAAENAANSATDQKLKNYTTTTQYSQLSQTVDGISTEVGKKVGNTEIISRINQSPEQVSIDADKVNLGGAVIVERINDTTADVSIDADKINLNGAVTANNYFKINNDGSFETIMGLIGAIHIIANALYSGSHNTPTSANDGFYLGADGSVSIGNGTNYIRWTKNNQNQFVLDVRLPSLKIGGSDAATQSNVASALSSANSYSDGVLASAQTYADGKATDALNSANSATDTKLQGYATTGALEDAITDSEATAAATYQTQSDASSDLAEAKTYADGKASTAESNAKTYAQGQASSALTNANSYTDGKHATAMSAASDAAKTATNYLYYDSTNGLVVSETGTADGSQALPFNTQIRAGDIRLRSRSKVLLQLDGDAVRIYRGESKLGMLLSAAGLYFMNADGATTAASITTDGLFVRSGKLGGFQVTSSANNGTTEDGGHLYADSFFIHASDADYEYELGFHGYTSRTASGFYVARIDKGSSWSTSNATFLTHLTNDGTFTTQKASIGKWTVGDGMIYSNKMTLDATNHQFVFGSYNKDSASTSRSKAFIQEDGRSSFKSVLVDEFSVGDEMPWNISAQSGWNSFSAKRGYLYFHGLYSKSNGVNVVIDSSDGRVYRAAASSIRYKDVNREMSDEDIKPAYDLRPVLAKYKEGYLHESDPMNGKEMPMFIAEEVAKTIPEAVIYNAEGEVEDWNARVIIPVQHQMILDQKNRIDKLESELADMKKLLKEVLNANK